MVFIHKVAMHTLLFHFIIVDAEPSLRLHINTVILKNRENGKFAYSTYIFKEINIEMQCKSKFKLDMCSQDISHYSIIPLYSKLTESFLS